MFSFRGAAGQQLLVTFSLTNDFRSQPDRLFYQRTNLDAEVKLYNSTGGVLQTWARELNGVYSGSSFTGPLPYTVGAKPLVLEAGSSELMPACLAVAGPAAPACCPPACRLACLPAICCNAKQNDPRLLIFGCKPADAQSPALSPADTLPGHFLHWHQRYRPKELLKPCW